MSVFCPGRCDRGRRFGAAALGTLLAGLVACAEAGAPGPPELDVQGHRGARGLRPENTLPAFAHALELGVSTLELDVGVTRDRRVVVLHDHWIHPGLCLGPDGAPLEGERGPLVRDLTGAEIARFDCGQRNADPERFPEPPKRPVPGAGIPTLEAVFDLVRASGDDAVRLNIETKLTPGDEATLPVEDFVAVVLDAIAASGLADRISIQSFDWRSLAIVKRRMPALETVGLLAPETFTPEWLDGIDPAQHGGDVLAVLRASGGRVEVLSPWWKQLLPGGPTPQLDVAAIQAAGFPVVPWTVNEPEVMRQLIALGVAGIITDYPDRLLEVAREEAVRVR